MGIDITGWHIHRPGIRFGLGYAPDQLPIEAAEFLAGQNDLKGNVLNTSMGQGDLLIWKAYPKRLTYVDSRTALFPQALLEKWHRLRTALRDDEVETWKPLLDEYKISVVMIEPSDSRLTYEKLKDSRNWVPFYDDGLVVMFGRADAPKEDLAIFEANRLKPDRVYHVTRMLPSAEGPPTPTSWMDEVFENRSLGRFQMRTQSADRWLTSGLGRRRRCCPSRRAACSRSRTPASPCRATPTIRSRSASSTRRTRC